MALHTDPNLKNPWGISTTVGAPLWLSDNGTGLSTLYDGKGVAAPAATPLVVTDSGRRYADARCGRQPDRHRVQFRNRVHRFQGVAHRSVAILVRDRGRHSGRVGADG